MCYHQSRLHGWRLFGGISLQDGRVSPVCESHSVATLHNPSLLPQALPKHWRYPTHADDSLLTNITDPIIRVGCSKTWAVHVLSSHRDHLPLWGHERRPVTEAEFGLQRVEVDLQLTFLLNFRWFVKSSVVPEILQLLLHGLHGVLRNAVLQPRDGSANPLQQLKRERKKWEETTKRGKKEDKTHWEKLGADRMR